MSENYRYSENTFKTPKVQYAKISQLMEVGQFDRYVGENKGFISDNLVSYMNAHRVHRREVQLSAQSLTTSGLYAHSHLNRK